jgi:hypothetical protein
MTSDTTLEDDFELFKDIHIKHSLKLNIYQYRPKCDYISNATPKQVAAELAMRDFRKQFSGILPIPPEINNEEDQIKLLKTMADGMMALQKVLQQNIPQRPIKDVKVIEGYTEEEIKK